MSQPHAHALTRSSCWGFKEALVLLTVGVRQSRHLSLEGLSPGWRVGMARGTPSLPHSGHLGPHPWEVWAEPVVRWQHDSRPSAQGEHVLRAPMSYVGLRKLRGAPWPPTCSPISPVCGLPGGAD